MTITSDATIGKNHHGWRIRTPRYEAQIVAGAAPTVHVYREGWRLLRLPAVSGLASVDAAECLTDIKLEPPVATGNGIRLALTARSSLWGERQFAWEFGPDGLTYQHGAKGTVRPGRCYFFANGPATRKGPTLPGNAKGAMQKGQQCKRVRYICGSPSRVMPFRPAMSSTRSPTPTTAGAM